MKPSHGNLQVNKRGHKLQCSHYKPSDTTAEHGRPIVVYCHCNSGSRRDAEEAFYVLIPQDVTVFCLDFSVSSWTMRCIEVLGYWQKGERGGGGTVCAWKHWYRK